MNLRKFLCVLLAFSMIAVPLAACSSSDDTEITESDESETSGTETDDTIDTDNTTEDTDTTVTDNTGDDTGDDTNTADDSGSAEEDYDYSFYSEGLDENGYFEGVTALDYVTVPELVGLELPDKVTVVDSETIQNEIDSVLSSFGGYEHLTEGVIADGDTVNIDYVGSVDGVEFDGGSTNGAGTTVTIGVTSYIDGFLEQLIGHSPGENFDINVTFPDPYENNTDLSGADAVFNITVNWIQGEYTQPTELTDGMAEYMGYESLAEMMSEMESYFLNLQQQEYFNEIVDQAEVSGLPDSVYEYFYNLNLNGIKIVALQYGLEPDDYISTYTEYASSEELLEDYRESIEEDAKRSLAIQAMAESAGVVVTDEEIEQSSYADYVEDYGMPYFKFDLLSSKLFDYILDNAAQSGEETQ